MKSCFAVIVILCTLLILGGAGLFLWETSGNTSFERHPLPDDSSKPDQIPASSARYIEPAVPLPPEVEPD